METILHLLCLEGNSRYHAADDAFIEAVENNQMETIRSFLGLCHINVLDKALTLAAEKNFTEIVKLLIDEGADINARSRITDMSKNGISWIKRDGGVTALDFARFNENSEMIEILKKAGAK